MHLISVVLISGIIIATAETDVSICPSNLLRTKFLRQNGSSCYEFVLNHHGYWANSDRDCKRRGGHLVTIGSATEQAFIFKSLKELHFQHDRGVWIGLTDQDNEGTWKWVTGELLASRSYQNWATGQPGLIGTLEDCALLEFRDGGHWHDFACHGVLFNTQNHAWICEYAVLNTSSTETNATMPTSLPNTSSTTTNPSMPTSSPHTSPTKPTYLSAILTITAATKKSPSFNASVSTSATTTPPRPTTTTTDQVTTTVAATTTTTAHASGKTTVTQGITYMCTIFDCACTLT